MSKGAPRHNAPAADPDDLFTRYTEVADRLAELLPEARAVCTDLVRETKAARRALAEIRAEAASAASAAASAEFSDVIARWNRDLQGKVNGLSDTLNQSIDRARDAIVAALVPIRAEIMDSPDLGEVLAVSFMGGKFNAGIPLPPDPEHPPGVDAQADALAAKLIGLTDGQDPAETADMLRNLDTLDPEPGPSDEDRTRALAAAFRRRGREDLAAAIESLILPDAYRRKDDPR